VYVGHQDDEDKRKPKPKKTIVPNIIEQFSNTDQNKKE
jgi:hypothetical protein